MTIDEFWNIIDKAKHTMQPEKKIEIVTQKLKKLSPEEIVSYQRHFDTLHSRAYKWDLWGAIYLLHGGCGDDSFMDFRYSLISMGKEVYSNALANPDSLANWELNDDEDERDEEFFNEGFGYIAIEVYKEKTEEEIYDYREDIDKEENLGEEWNFDDRNECMKRLPKLTMKFWEE